MERTELKDWRKRWGMSQARLAEALGVRHMTVARWEWGTRRIPPFLHLALKALELEFKKGGKGEHAEGSARQASGGITREGGGFYGSKVERTAQRFGRLVGIY